MDVKITPAASETANPVTVLANGGSVPVALVNSDDSEVVTVDKAVVTTATVVVDTILQFTFGGHVYKVPCLKVS